MYSEIELRYHARKLQVDAIHSIADEQLLMEIEAHQEEFVILDAILLVSPALLPSVIERSKMSQEEFYNKALEAVVIASKRKRVLTVLNDLCEACDEEARGSREVSIDIAHSSIPPVFLKAFQDYQAQFVEAAERGVEDAAQAILNLIRGETILMRYRRDLIPERLALTPALDGGEIGYIPTTIEAVDFKFWYSKGEKFPKIALAVKPIE